MRYKDAWRRPARCHLQPIFTRPVIWKLATAVVARGCQGQRGPKSAVLAGSGRLGHMGRAVAYKILVRLHSFLEDLPNTFSMPPEGLRPMDHHAAGLTVGEVALLRRGRLRGRVVIVTALEMVWARGASQPPWCRTGISQMDATMSTPFFA